MCQEMRNSKKDFVILESALQSKSSAYDDHVKKLYEEMEAQIKAERVRIIAQVSQCNFISQRLALVTYRLFCLFVCLIVC